MATPAPGWTVAHQIAHLAWTDRLALLSATDPDAFVATVQAALGESSTYVDAAAAEGADDDPAALRPALAGRAGHAQPPPCWNCRPAPSCRGSARR